LVIIEASAEPENLSRSQPTPEGNQMRPWKFLFTKPGEGWEFATVVFSFSWGMATLVPLVFFWTVLIKGTPSDWEFLSWGLLLLGVNWAVASTFVLASFANLTRLVDRMRQLEESGAASRQPS
jgi:hypothetical protein